MGGKSSKVSEGDIKMQAHEEKEEHLKVEPGPMEKRSCTDILFLFLFAIFWGGMFVVANEALKSGNPERLINGVDLYGNTCGFNNLARNTTLRGRAYDLTSKPNLFFVPRYDNATNYQVKLLSVCVDSCPSQNIQSGSNLTSDLICAYDVAPVYTNVASGCTPKYATQSLVHRCIPTLGANLSEVVAMGNGIVSTLDLQQAKDLSYSLLSDMVIAWPYIAGSAGVAFLLAFLWLALMRKLAGVIVWGTIIVAVAVLTVLAAFFYKQSLMTAQNYSELPVQVRLASMDTVAKFCKGMFIFLAIVDCLIVLITMFMFTRIKIAIGLFKEASRAMMAMPFVLVVPVVIAISIAPLAVYWLYIGAYLATSGEATFDSNGNFTGYDATMRLRYLQIYHLFGGLWTLAFLHAIGDTTIAGAIGSYYWIHDKSKLSHVPVLKSFGRTIRYHMGSLIFGSLILAIVQTIRVIVNFVEQHMKGKENTMAKAALRCLDCILSCFERFIKFLNENAFVMVAIYGYTFCGGARRAFSLLASNILRVTALSCASSFLLFQGKVFVSALTTLIFFFVLRNNVNLSNFVLPCMAIAILAYAIAAAFFSVVKMAIRTVLLSFCEDCERNDGSEKKPYYMSDSLKSTIDAHHAICCC